MGSGVVRDTYMLTRQGRLVRFFSAERFRTRRPQIERMAAASGLSFAVVSRQEAIEKLTESVVRSRT